MGEEQYEQPAPQVKTSPYASPMHQFSGSLLTLTNPDSELYKLELSLRGQALDREGKPVQIGEAMLNNKGVTSVVGQTQALVSQVTVMSNLEQEEVIVLVDFVGDTLARDLMVNRDEYEIVNAASRDKIYFLVLSSAFITLKRAADEGERRFWKGSQQEIVTTVQGAMPKKKGGLGGLLGWGNK